MARFEGIMKTIFGARDNSNDQTAANIGRGAVQVSPKANSAASALPISQTTSTRSNAVSDALSRADKARDELRWADAALFYAEHLSTEPNDAPITVQWGHALKESGDVSAALTAYLHASTLDPQNSDTAIQIGHALKILGRRQEAIDWYFKSLPLLPRRNDGWRELAGLGVSPLQIQIRLRQQRASQALENAVFAWTVESFPENKGAGAASLLWSDKLRDAVWQRGNVEKFGSPNQPGIWSALVGISDQNQKKKLDTTLESLGNLFARRLVHVTGLPQEPYLFDEIFTTADVIVTNAKSDADLLRGRARSQGRSIPILALEPYQLVKMGDVSKVDAAGPDIVVLASDVLFKTSIEEKKAGEGIDSQPFKLSSLAKQIVEVHKKFRPGHGLVFVAQGNVGSHTPADIKLYTKAFASIKDVTVVEAAKGLSLLKDASTVTVQADAIDADCWIVLSAEAGAFVIAERSPRLHALFGAVIRSYINMPDGLPDIWGTNCFRTKPTNHLSAATAEAFEDVLSEASKATLPNGEPEKQIGRFLSLAAGGSGLRLVQKANRNFTNANGCYVGTNGLSMKLPDLEPANGPLRVVALLANSVQEPNKWRMDLQLGPHQSAQELACPGGWWGWLPVDCEYEAVDLTVFDLQIKFSTNHKTQSFSKDSPMLFGIFIYPVNDDAAWFAFLDKASRGSIPELQSARRWATSI